MAPGESSRLATTWTAAGAGSSLSVAMIVVGPVADGTLGRDVYAWRQSAPKGLAKDHLGFATTIARCHIEPGDASLPGRPHGRHRLVAGGWTPDLPNAATAEGESTDVTE